MSNYRIVSDGLNFGIEQKDWFLWWDMGWVRVKGEERVFSNWDGYYYVPKDLVFSTIDEARAWILKKEPKPFLPVEQ